MRKASRAVVGALVLVGAAITVACAERDATAEEHRPVHIDSIFPIEEEVRRFRADLDGSVVAFDAGAQESPDALVRTFMHALEARDAETLLTLVLTRTEFIDLYYPHTHFTSKPYELSPQLVWFQLENYGSRGLTRALQRYGGRELGYGGYRCESDVEEGPNRILGGCLVRIGGGTEVSLFGRIIVRGGRAKFINYGNTL